MGGASRFITLLTTPFPLIYQRRPSLLLRLASPRSRLSSIASISTSPQHLSSFSSSSSSRLRNSTVKASSEHIHTQSSGTPRDDCVGDFRGSHPWLEWSKLVKSLAVGGYYDRQRFGTDEFVGIENLSDDFVRSAIACLEFARDRPNLLGVLSRVDIEVIVQNGSPYLFKDALDSARRMRLYLSGGVNNVLESDIARTVDVVKFLLSYASNPSVAPEKGNLHNRELVESSVRNLLSELAVHLSSPSSSLFNPEQRQTSVEYGQTPRPTAQNIEMKRGDWICPKCSFMNFARNKKCLECEEARPMRQITGGEWECPQCDFYNYSRNIVCLRCDCKRPGETPYATAPSNVNNGNYANKAEINSRLAANEEKAERWFSKVSQLDNSTDLTSAIPDEDFPEIMPLRKGVNRFVVSTRKTPLERRLANAEYRRNLGNGSENNNLQTDVNSRILDDILGRNKEDNGMKNSNSHSADNLLLSEKPVNQTENREKEEAEKSERWFKRVAELHNVTDLASEISDEDFPEIMPMRKGENRFVVSKKKDRSLTSSAQKRSMAMEQASNSNFVPFVPFPPDYFAKKDKPKEETTTASSSTSVAEEKPNTNANENINTGISAKENSSSAGNSTQTNENQNVRDSWRGKSLEGSAVKEPDPLDMSEEAKAERWFRRVAQIKDISELSQIPDEDFPSIMPMRKGVNRFVVSKRKTPLERRLTSSQYRRNLPTISSDPVKKENEGGS